jgi:hypothetical protein
LNPRGTWEDKRPKTKDKSAERRSFVFMTERLNGLKAREHKGTKAKPLWLL